MAGGSLEIAGSRFGAGLEIGAGDGPDQGLRSSTHDAVGRVRFAISVGW